MYELIKYTNENQQKEQHALQKVKEHLRKTVPQFRMPVKIIWHLLVKYYNKSHLSKCILQQELLIHINVLNHYLFFNLITYEVLLFTLFPRRRHNSLEGKIE